MEALNLHLKRASRPSLCKAGLSIGFDWLVIGASWVVGSIHPLCWLLVAPIIAGRQHGLFVLMHDGAHYRFSKSRGINNFMADYLCGFWIFMSLSAYRKNHSKHHELTNTNGDPDWVRKNGKADWSFPMEKKQFGWSVARYLFGFGLLEMAYAIPILSGLSDESPKIRLGAKIRVASLISILFAFATFGGASLVIWGWLFPYFFFFPLFNRVRSVAEHFGIKNSNAFTSSRNVLSPTWLERLTVAPHGVNYHLVHHLFPSVCFHALKDFEKTLKNSMEGYSEQAHQTATYFSNQSDSVFSEVIGRVRA